MKKIVCITGGMGSGKSTVARFLLEADFAVYNSDTRAGQAQLAECVQNPYLSRKSAIRDV